MSRLPPPPLREKDRTSREWDRWFEEVRRLSIERQAHVANAVTTHAVSDFAGTNSALDALGTKVNALLTALESAKVLDNT